MSRYWSHCGCCSINSTIDSNKSAGNWFSTLTWTAIASETSTNLCLITVTHPSAHAAGPTVKKIAARVVASVSKQESLPRRGFAGQAPGLLPRPLASCRDCQGAKRFPAFDRRPAASRPIGCWTMEEKLWKTSARRVIGRVFRGADRSPPLAKQSRSAVVLLH